MKKIILTAMISCVLLACGEDIHSVQNQDTPDIQNPDIQNPDIQNPDIQNPDIQNPDIQNPDIQNPDIQNPDVQNPDIQNPDIQNPDIQNPDVQNPGKPVRPVFPGKPGTHEPTLPNTPTIPDTPDQPDNPDTPDQPDNPDNPDTPAEPDPDLPDIDAIPFTIDTVELPGGVFTDRDGNQVQIKHFRMMQTEVPTSWFWACLNRGKCINTDIIKGGGDQFFTSDEYYEWNEQILIDYMHLPVHHVRHIGAEHFCKWVGGRLPTEAEWEYAALYDGEKVRDVTYPWGNDAPQFCVNSNYQTGEDLVCRSPEQPYTHILEKGYHFILIDWLQKGRTPTGLYNMAGNVMEYVAEYEEFAVVPSSHMDCPKYILKGGSANSSPDKLAIREREYFQKCSSEDQTYYPEDERDIVYNGELAGFRCVFDE